MKRIGIFAAFALLTCSALFAASGGVSEGEQYWKGKKVFDDNVPNVATLAGNVTLSKASKRVQVLDPGGSSRNITLPEVVASKGYEFFIVNAADDAEDLVVKNAGATTIVTISQNQCGLVWSDGVNWTGVAFTSSASGFLAADGTVEGATDQAQVFTNGVDVNGGADTVILDADADTTISAPTDDQIDIEISGADDFTFTANTFTALSGSSIATNTIAETTAASGVTIDSTLIKDGGVTTSSAGLLALGNVGTKAAAGSAQGDATAITHQITYVTASDGNKGVILPAASAGAIYIVYDTVATSGLKIYPASGDDINDGTSDTAITIEGKTMAIFVGVDSTTWAAMFTSN